MGKELEAKTQKETAKILSVYRNLINIIGKPGGGIPGKKLLTKTITLKYKHIIQ